VNVRDVMTPGVIGINPAAAIAEAGALMLQNGVSALLVIDHAGGLVGILSEGDLLERCELAPSARHIHGLKRSFSRAGLWVNICDRTVAGSKM